MSSDEDAAPGAHDFSVPAPLGMKRCRGCGVINMKRNLDTPCTPDPEWPIKLGARRDEINEEVRQRARNARSRR